MTSDASSAEQVFAQIRAETGWDIEGPMLWGYFFIDGSPQRLETLGEHLRAEGYPWIVVHQQADEDTGAVQHVLHVERVEAHSPSSLEARNLDFVALASAFDVAAYDGIDVGPATDAHTADSDA